MTPRYVLISIVALTLQSRDTPAVYPVSRLVDHGDSHSWDYSGTPARTGGITLASLVRVYSFFQSPACRPHGLAKKYRPFRRQLLWLETQSSTSLASKCAPRGAKHPAPNFVESLFQMLTCQYENPGVGLRGSWGSPLVPGPHSRNSYPYLCCVGACREHCARLHSNNAT